MGYVASYLHYLVQNCRWALLRHTYIILFRIADGLCCVILTLSCSELKMGSVRDGLVVVGEIIAFSKTKTMAVITGIKNESLDRKTSVNESL